MAITMDQIKELRATSGAGMLDVKKALEAADGDMDKALEWLKKKGLERADNKSDRETGVNRVFSYVHFNATVGAMVQLSCETDVVAKTDDFATLGKELAMQVVSMSPENVEAFLEQDYLRDSKKTIKELVKEVSGKTGENVQVTQIVRLG